MKKPAEPRAPAAPSAPAPPPPVALTCPACGTVHPVDDARCDECKRSGRTDP